MYVFQVMTSRPRSDIYINLPALRKLDAMLLVRTLLSAKIKIFSFDEWFCFSPMANEISFVHRIYWTASRRQSFGMQIREACREIQRVLDHSGGYFSLSLNEQMKNGGCRFLAFLLLVYLRNQLNICYKSVIVPTKFTKPHCPSIIAFLLKWRYQNHTLQLCLR